MKTVLYAIAFLLIAQFSLAQTYPYPQPGTMQGINYIDNFYSPPSNSSKMYVGDTVMCGYTYGVFCGLSYQCQNGIATHYFREDAGKVYYLPYSCVNQEVLYYDFNLSVGDTFMVQTFVGGLSIVDSVGTMLMLNGQTRKYIRLIGIGYGNAFEWVEGIGDLERGFLSLADFEGGHEVLVCHKDASGLVWVNPNYSYDCDSILLFTPVGISDIKPIEFEIVPNPITTTGTVHFEGELNIKEIILYNVIGEKVITYSSTTLNGLTISADGLNPGIYFLSVDTDSGLLTKKVLIN